MNIRNTKFWRLLRFIRRFIRHNVINIAFFTVYKSEITFPGSREIKDQFPISFRIGNIDDILELTKKEHTYDNAAKKKAAESLKRGDDVIIGSFGKKVVFYAWVAYEEMDLGFKDFDDLPAGTAYVYKIHTIQKFRRKGYFLKFFQFIHNYLDEKGYQAILSEVDNKNLPSIKAHLKLGFKPFGSIISITFFGIHFNHYKINNI